MSEIKNETSLVIDDTHYITQYTRKFINRKKYKAPNPKEIRAFIPGTIRKIYVKPGQEVRRGDSLFLLEAMKMKNDVASPRDGRIKSVGATIDRMVAKNELLVEFE
jgi:biotin carboxyl carrier protein